MVATAPLAGTLLRALLIQGAHDSQTHRMLPVATIVGAGMEPPKKDGTTLSIVQAKPRWRSA